MKQYNPRIQIKPTTFSSQFTPKCHHLNTNNKPKTFPNFKFKFIFKPNNSTPNPSPSQTLISILRSIPDWADTIKERGMQKNRTLYTHPTWLNHRSSRRHLRHFLSSLSSRVILSLIPPVIAFTAFSAAIAAYNSAVLLNFLPEFFPLLRASSLPYQLTAPALALLLVFRTEASYSRFVEGKKAWTSVIAGAHDFVRQVMASVVTPSDLPIKKALLQYIMAFPLVLKVTMVAFSVGSSSILFFCFSFHRWCEL